MLGYTGPGLDGQGLWPMSPAVYFAAATGQFIRVVELTGAG